MNGLGANALLLALVLYAAGVMGLWGAGMWALGFPPDQYPALVMLGAVSSSVATYYGARAAFGGRHGR